MNDKKYYYILVIMIMLGILFLGMLCISKAKDYHNREKTRIEILYPSIDDGR